MALIFSLWWPGFLALARLAVLRLAPADDGRAGPLGGLEYVRAYLLTGFPWYYLGHSQHRFLALIQVADITGALGISFLIAVVNAWVVDLLTLPLLRRTPGAPADAARRRVRLWTVAVLVGGTWSTGPIRLSHGPVPRRARGSPCSRRTSSSGTRWAADPVVILDRIPAPDRARGRPRPSGPT